MVIGTAISHREPTSRRDRYEFGCVEILIEMLRYSRPSTTQASDNSCWRNEPCPEKHSIN